MAKVGAKIGLTLKLFKDGSYEFIRPEISIEDIDTEKDVTQQLADAEVALTETWEKTKEQLDQKILAEMPQVEEQMQLQISNKFKTFEKAIKVLVDRVKKLEGDK
jgi:hypothetical protein